MQPSVRTFVALCAVAVAVVLYIKGAYAAPRGQLRPRPFASQAQVSTVQGELLQVDAKASMLAIKTPSTEMKFRYNEETRVSGVKNGVAGLATMAGSQVTVQYRMDSNVAINIEVHRSSRRDGIEQR